MGKELICLVCFHKFTGQNKASPGTNSPGVVSEELFALFCKYMKILPKNRDLAHPVFCSTCLESVTLLSQLNSEIEALMKQTAVIVGKCSAKIIESYERQKDIKSSIMYTCSECWTDSDLKYSILVDGVDGLFCRCTLDEQQPLNRIRKFIFDRYNPEVVLEKREVPTISTEGQVLIRMDVAEIETGDDMQSRNELLDVDSAHAAGSVPATVVHSPCEAPAGKTETTDPYQLETPQRRFPDFSHEPNVFEDLTGATGATYVDVASNNCKNDLHKESRIAQGGAIAHPGTSTTSEYYMTSDLEDQLGSSSSGGPLRQKKFLKEKTRSVTSKIYKRESEENTPFERARRGLSLIGSVTHSVTLGGGLYRGWKSLKAMMSGEDTTSQARASSSDPHSEAVVPIPPNDL